MLVELRVGIEHIVRTNNGGITAGIATADISFFEYRNIGNAVQACQVISGCEAMSATTNDNDVVLFLWLRVTPGPGPAAIAGECLLDQAESRIMHRRRVVVA